MALNLLMVILHVEVAQTVKAVMLSDDVEASQDCYFEEEETTGKLLDVVESLDWAKGMCVWSGFACTQALVKQELLWTRDLPSRPSKYFELTLVETLGLPYAELVHTEMSQTRYQHLQVVR